MDVNVSILMLQFVFFRRKKESLVFKVLNDITDKTKCRCVIIWKIFICDEVLADREKENHDILELSIQLISKNCLDLHVMNLKAFNFKKNQN